ncbi:hypothetical protein DI272_01480 [Streptomyces sp. Act143]|nr:hypothetical protein DI272_01480 [Streptomyces sp. Act143]
MLGPPRVGTTHIAAPSRSRQAGPATRSTSSALTTCSAPQSRRARRLAPEQARHLPAAQLLVVDEVGYQPLERAEANLFFQVISKH